MIGFKHSRNKQAVRGYYLQFYNAIATVQYEKIMPVPTPRYLILSREVGAKNELIFLNTKNVFGLRWDSSVTTTTSNPNRSKDVIVAPITDTSGGLSPSGGVYSLVEKRLFLTNPEADLQDVASDQPLSIYNRSNYLVEHRWLDKLLINVNVVSYNGYNTREADLRYYLARRRMNNVGSATATEVGEYTLTFTFPLLRKENYVTTSDVVFSDDIDQVLRNNTAFKVTNGLTKFSLFYNNDPNFGGGVVNWDSYIFLSDTGVDRVMGGFAAPGSPSVVNPHSTLGVPFWEIRPRTLGDLNGTYSGRLIQAETSYPQQGVRSFDRTKLGSDSAILATSRSSVGFPLALPATTWHLDCTHFLHTEEKTILVFRSTDNLYTHTVEYPWSGNTFTNPITTETGLTDVIRLRLGNFYDDYYSSTVTPNTRYFTQFELNRNVYLIYFDNVEKNVFYLFTINFDNLNTPVFYKRRVPTPRVELNTEFGVRGLYELSKDRVLIFIGQRFYIVPTMKTNMN